MLIIARTTGKREWNGEGPAALSYGGRAVLGYLYRDPSEFL